MRRIKKKIKIRLKKSSVVILLICGVLIGLFLAFDYVNKMFLPMLVSYAEIEASKLSSIIINNAVGKYVTDNIDIDEFFIITRDNNGDIKTMDFNPLTVNKILTDVTNNIQINLKYIEQGRVDLLTISTDSLIDYDIDKLKEGIIYEIPSGIVTGNSLLSNIGPKIPIRFSLIGNISSYVATKVTNYGINNALIEINIVLELTEQLILPFGSDKMVFETSIPVGLKMIQGSVPDYYMNGMDTNSPLLTVPIN